MPAALLRPCPRCRIRLTSGGPCQGCKQGYEQARGTATERGYDSYWSKVFRPQYLNLLVQADIAPVCGAALPNGPATTDSQCKAQGIINGRGLHLDHEPRLTAAERSDRRAVCNPLRIQLLCASCHGAKDNDGRFGR